MRALLDQTVRELRLGHTAAANDSLARVLDALATELAQEPRRANVVLPILREVLAGQQRGDWLWVADLLEHELPRALATAQGPS